MHAFGMLNSTVCVCVQLVIIEDGNQWWEDGANRKAEVRLSKTPSCALQAAWQLRLLLHALLNTSQQPESAHAPCSMLRGLQGARPSSRL